MTSKRSFILRFLDWMNHRVQKKRKNMVEKYTYFFHENGDMICTLIQVSTKMVGWSIVTLNRKSMILFWREKKPKHSGKMKRVKKIRKEAKSKNGSEFEVLLMRIFTSLMDLNTDEAKLLLLLLLLWLTSYIFY